ncbi:trypsin-like serine peptidase [Thermorudis peleae]|uniref:trypsin-like serine peptidase n=1 Tax=Thermorudis peleae TaxID=1382356 RepID=UPI0006901615|nr:trypsin-like serine protease [Thermorudis peleae]
MLRQVVVAVMVVLGLLAPTWLASTVVPASVWAPAAQAAASGPLTPIVGTFQPRPVDPASALATVAQRAAYQRIFGVDNRIRVTDTTRFPFSAITLILGTEADGTNYLCSGALIGPNVLLTAAHCLFDPVLNAFSSTLFVVPGADLLNGKPFAPFGYANAVQGAVPVGWQQSGGDPTYDVGIVLLDTPLGRNAGMLAPENASTALVTSPSFSYLISGYPGDKPLGTQWMVSAQGFTGVTSTLLDTQAALTEGMSGSPVLNTSDLGIIGLVSFEMRSANVARRITADIFTFLTNYCVQHSCQIAAVSRPGSSSQPVPMPTPTPMPTPIPSPTSAPQPTPQPMPTPMPLPAPQTTPAPQPAPVPQPPSALQVAAQPAPPSANPACISFPQTQHNLCYGFRAYWQRFGGLAIFGYPITEEYTDPTTGYVTQWFERARFEWHPGQFPQRYDVLLGLLGDEITAGRQGQAPFLPAQPNNAPGCVYFAQTGHNVCGDFLAFWQQNGGLATFGYPISEPFAEPNPDTGQVYTVQYFERQRFEAHPEANVPYHVLLGRLGAQLLTRQMRLLS